MANEAVTPEMVFNLTMLCMLARRREKLGVRGRRVKSDDLSDDLDSLCVFGHGELAAIRRSEAVRQHFSRRGHQVPLIGKTSLSGWEKENAEAILRKSSLHFCYLIETDQIGGREPANPLRSGCTLYLTDHGVECAQRQATQYAEFVALEDLQKKPLRHAGRARS